MTMLIVLTGMSSRVDAYEIGGFEIKPVASVSETYDDNVTYVKNNQKNDWITGLGAGLDIAKEGKTSQWQLTGSITEHLFANNRDFNNTSEDFSFNHQRKISDTESLSVVDSFSHAEEPRSFSEAFAAVVGRYSYDWNRFNVEYLRTLNKQSSVIFRYGNEVYKSSAKDVINSIQNKNGIEWDYSLNPTSVLLGSFDFSLRDFDPGSYALFYKPALGINKSLTRQVSMESRVGADFIQDAFGKKQTEPNIFVSLRSRPDVLTQMSFYFAKRYDTNRNDSDLFDFWQVEWMLQRNLTKRLVVALSNFYGNGRYVASDIKEKFQGVTPSLSYELPQNTQIILSYSYSHVTSHDETREYLKNMFFLEFKANF